MRSRMAAIVTAAWASSRSAHAASCSGENTSTSWMPLAAAWVNTGPRLCTVQRLVAVERGVAVGHHPHDPVALPAVGLERRRGRLLVAGAERAGQRRVGLDGQLAGDEVAGAVRRGRRRRSTHRPVSGLSRSWLMRTWPAARSVRRSGGDSHASWTQRQRIASPGPCVRRYGAPSGPRSGGEGLAAPPGVALDQPQARLGRQARRARRGRRSAAPTAAGGSPSSRDLHVLAGDRAGGRVEAADGEHHLVEPDVAGLDRAHRARRARRRAAGRTPRPPAARRAPAAAATRARQRRWAAVSVRLNRVLKAHSTTRRSACRRAPARAPPARPCRRPRRGRASPPGLARSRSSMAAEASTAHTSRPRLGERDGEAPAARAQLEHAARRRPARPARRPARRWRRRRTRRRYQSS